MKCHINTSPTHLDLEEIEKWLKAEDENLNEGFFCNWSIIEKAFNQDRLVIIEYDNVSVGFLTWRKEEIYSEIDIIEIRPEYRNQGIGEIFLNKFSDFLRLQRILAIKLFCSPPESERFWKKMGFIQFPERGYAEPDLTYYKPLIETQTTSKKGEGQNIIELWNVAPDKIHYNSPKWTWQVEIKNNEVEKPIIQPCNPDWNLRWTKNGVIIREEKVKYFGKKGIRIFYSPFLYLKEL